MTSSRLLKKTHRRRYRSIASLQRTRSTPPLVEFSRASPLDLFEQPARGFFQHPASGLSRPSVYFLVLLALASLSCRQEMADQPNYRPLVKSDFFADDRSARPAIPGTVARGQLREDEQFHTGKLGGEAAATFPSPVTRETLYRGQERFDIFCSPCHDRVGNGQGMIVRRGFRSPPSLHIDRLREARPGYFFDVISRGFGTMPDYAEQIPPEDRWAIVAYIRALQLSQQAAVTDAPENEQRRLRESEP